MQINNYFLFNIIWSDLYFNVFIKDRMINKNIKVFGR